MGSSKGHALLSPSGAEKWINCPPSAKLEARFPSRGSEYAEEGTLYHALCAMLLQIEHGSGRRSQASSLATIKDKPLYSAEMQEHADDAIAWIKDRYEAYQILHGQAKIAWEHRVDLSAWVPGGYGTADIVIQAGDTLEIVDLKYGAGVLVPAARNPQLMLYALGAMSDLTIPVQVQTVIMTIYQPRRGHIDSEQMAAADLLAWADSTVRPAAALAALGRGEHKTGDHCRWCRAKGVCKARADDALGALRYETVDPALLPMDELGALIHVAEKLGRWAKDVKDYADMIALEGAEIPGWKLVEGRSNRTITDKDAAYKILLGQEKDRGKFIRPAELLGLTALEKNFGKKGLAGLIGGLIKKPQGRPVLVPDSDPREKLGSPEEAMEGIPF